MFTKWTGQGLTIVGSGPKAFLFLLVLTVFFISASLFFISSSGTDRSLDLIDDHPLESDRMRYEPPMRSFDTQVADGMLDEEMARRRLTVDRICRHLWLHKRTWKWEPKDFDHIIVDDRHRLLYCFVAKVASTNWKRIFMILQGNLTHDPLNIPANESHRPNRFRFLSNYSISEVDYRLRHYFKFLFARHPFERVLSAFRNKFEKDNPYFHPRFGSLILQRFRENVTAEEVATGANVTFEEFVRYLVDVRTREDGPLNEHWRPVHEMCHPCAVHYDVVGKYEGLDREAPYVLRRAGVDGRVRFPRINRTIDTFSLLDSYFGSLSSTHVFHLYQLYTLDFKMFGYEYPRFGHFAAKRD